jgi:acetoin utilization deacetylase AcuC-like enzyme
MSSTDTGLVFDPRFLAHDTGVEATVTLRDQKTFELSPQPHPSSLVITQRIKEFLDGAGMTARMRPIATRPATEKELLLYHTRAYLEGIRAYSAGGPSSGPWGYVDEDTILSPESIDAAVYSVGGALNAVAAIMEGQVRNAYALLRPPGHHATANEALGFCVFNDAVLAAHTARNVYGLERILILDWDVHHGNGIQDAFYEDPGVLFISLHQQNWYPEGAGELDQTGQGPGEGFTVNIPLPPGTGDRGYLAAFEHLVVPIAQEFRPELIIVVAGQDASWLDPLAHMMVTMAGYRRMSELIVALAQEVCDGRLLMLQAGGYSASYVPYCAVAGVEPLLGIDLGIVDLYFTAPELKRCQSIFSQETQRALQEACDWHRRSWKL